MVSFPISISHELLSDKSHCMHSNSVRAARQSTRILSWQSSPVERTEKRIGKMHGVVVHCDNPNFLSLTLLKELSLVSGSINFSEGCTARSQRRNWQNQSLKECVSSVSKSKNTFSCTLTWIATLIEELTFYRWCEQWPSAPADVQ